MPAAPNTSIIPAVQTLEAAFSADRLPQTSFLYLFIQHLGMNMFLSSLEVLKMGLVHLCYLLACFISLS